VSGANVKVTCTHGDYENTLSNISNKKGSYTVEFNSEICTYEDVVTVDATDGSQYGRKIVTLAKECTGENEGCLYDFGSLNLAMIDVPLVPEFGVFAGALTLLSAVGIFFMVRRK
jgi:hypothetical protein